MREPSCFAVFVGVGICGVCGGQVRIMRDREKRELVYRDKHEGDPGVICPGSETEADESEVLTPDELASRSDNPSVQVEVGGKTATFREAACWPPRG